MQAVRCMAVCTRQAHPCSMLLRCAGRGMCGICLLLARWAAAAAALLLWRQQTALLLRGRIMTHRRRRAVASPRTPSLRGVTAPDGVALGAMSAMYKHGTVFWAHSGQSRYLYSVACHWAGMTEVEREEHYTSWDSSEWSYRLEGGGRCVRPTVGAEPVLLASATNIVCAMHLHCRSGAGSNEISYISVFKAMHVMK
eukprot:COSAG01_NODE_5597_length_4156_cov_15.159724_2_plen_197_part_00